MDEALADAGVTLHYCAGDLDHNRTVTAFSGPAEQVRQTLHRLADIALPAIDLNHHLGVHPRIGGLDVCPFVLLEGEESEALKWVETVASELSEKWELPVYLYEKSERGEHPSDLPTLRKGGFGGLLARELRPDFGPNRAHPNLGASVFGLRDFLLALNVNLSPAEPELAKQIAQGIRKNRAEGVPGFLGVRALGFPLTSRKISQVSMNLTLPNQTPIDPIVDWVTRRARLGGATVRGTELIGVIRPRDLEHALSLAVKPAQVVEAP